MFLITLCTVCSLTTTMPFASQLCLPGYTISLSCIHVSTILPYPYSISSQPRSSSVSKVHLLPIAIYQLVHCDLGKVERITTQSMLLINHISHSRTTEVAAARQRANAPNFSQANCRLSEVSGSKLEIQRIKQPVVNVCLPVVALSPRSCWSDTCF